MKPIKTKVKKFKINPKYPHKRSEGLTKRRNKGSIFQKKEVNMITHKQVINQIIKKNKDKHLDVLKKIREEKDDIPTKDFDQAKDLNKREREHKK